MKHPGDAVTTYGYNDANMVISMATSTDDLGNVTNLAYTYYTDGNQRTKTDSVNNITTTYTYDDAGQLKTEVKTGSVNQTDLYTYDASGNRTQKIEQRPNAVNKTITNTYNSMNQLVESFDNLEESTTFYYDELGNLTSDGNGQYQYDYCNRLGYVYSNKKGSEYKYYIYGLRKSKGNTFFIRLDGNMVYKFTPSTIISTPKESPMTKQKNYKKTLIACYLGFVTQAISANFTPLLFLTFKGTYGITLDKIALIPVVFYLTQLIVDLAATNLPTRLATEPALSLRK